MDQLANAVITKLGGTTKVASIFGIKPPSVSLWRQHGIPKPRLMYLRLAYPEQFAEVAAELAHIETSEAA